MPHRVTQPITAFKLPPHSARCGCAITVAQGEGELCYTGIWCPLVIWLWDSIPGMVLLERALAVA